MAFWGMPGVQHGGVPSARYLAMGGGSPLTEEWYFADARYTWDQLAAFGEMSYRFTDQFTATFGIRAFESGYDKAPSPDFNIFHDPKTAGSGNSVDASSNDVIYKLNLSWQASDNLLGYFNFAQGFRPGGANTTAADDDIPDTYGGMSWTRTKSAGNRRSPMVE